MCHLPYLEPQQTSLKNEGASCLQAGIQARQPSVTSLHLSHIAPPQSHRSTSSCLCDFREITSPLWASISSALRWRHNSTWASDLVGHKWTSSHVWMWELYYKESWVLKNWCFWSVMLEKTLEGSLDGKEIQPVYPKGNQSRIFIGRTETETAAETPILWPPDVKNWLTRKDPDAGKDWRREEKGPTEDEMVG